MLRSVVQEFMELLGYTNYAVAGNGQEALEVLRVQPINLMLSDIRMPEMELEDVLKHTNHEFSDLIVIATSGYSDFQSAQHILESGAHDFLDKPLNLDALESALTWNVERRTLFDLSGSLIGKTDPNTAPHRDGPAIGELLQVLEQQIKSFPYHVKHCVRVCRLAEELDLRLDPGAVADFKIAALLHEPGLGFLMNSLCMLPRPLESEEVLLIHDHASFGGWLVSKTLGRPEFETIIGRHLVWRGITEHPVEGYPTEERLAVWLGVLNLIDGCLRWWPDRPSFKIATLQASLQQRHHRHPNPALESLLDQWESVVAFYESAEVARP